MHKVSQQCFCMSCVHVGRRAGCCKHARVSPAAAGAKNAAYDSTMDYVCDKETGALRLTSVGIEKYRSRFARAGIDVNQIKTADQFNRAMEKSFCDVVMHDWANDVRKKLPPSLDRNWLLAILQGDREESARLEKLVRRRESHFKS